MKVIKRDGRMEDVSFDKVLQRLQLLATGKNKKGDKFGKELQVDVIPICQKVISMITDGITTTELDEYAAATCANLVKIHPDYSDLASRITVSNHQKSTLSFVATMKLLYANKDKQGKPSPLLNNPTYKAILENQDQLTTMIDDSRDYLINYFGLKTLERSYLIKSQNGHQTIQERPQHMYMRVAVGLWGTDLEKVQETYDLLSTQKLSHASPTLFNCGTLHNQLSSCFHEDTEVFTINEGVKKIKDVKIGDQVITHTGSIKKVLQTHKNLQEDRKIFKLVCTKTKDVLVTGNHRFWSVKKGQKEPTWNAIDELKVGDHIGIPSYHGDIKEGTIDLLPYAELIIEENTDSVIEYKIGYSPNYLSLTTLFTHSNLNGVIIPVQASRESNTINRNLVIDGDLAELFGIFIGDGNIMTFKNKRSVIGIRGLNFTFSENNTTLIEFVDRVGKEKFGIDGKYYKIKNQNTCQIMYYSKILGVAFRELFGMHFDGKKIWDQVNMWDETLLDRFLAGLISTDGCVTKEGQITLSFSNYNLMDHLYHLLRNHGYDVSFQKRKNRPKLGTCDVYEMRIPIKESILLYVKKYYTDYRMEKVIDKCNDSTRNRNQHYSIIINGQKFIRINKLEETEEQFDYVYTLGIEDDHSYNVEGLVCENCFLSGIDDSLEGIYTALMKNAMISKFAGGIGIWVHRIRASGSKIRGTNGKSDGLIPMLRVFNETARYVNQGGKRKGSIAIYLEPHHADIEDFLDMKKTHGNMNRRCLDLFPALWISDLFMKRLEQSLNNNEDPTVMWSLFCPDEAPNLEEAFGTDYEKLYMKYESERRYQSQIPIIHLWKKILDSQMETGIPYLLYKDPVNYRNAQMNRGTIKSSNLCVSPDTMILTDQGYYPIEELKDQNVNVWNGKEFSKTTVVQTGENQEMMEIEFSSGSKIKCTPYHKFYVQTKKPRHDPKNMYLNKKYVNVFEAKDLKPEMKIIKCEFPLIKDGEDFPYPYTHGAFCGDGTYEYKRDNTFKCSNKSKKNKAYCGIHVDYYLDDMDITEKCKAIVGKGYPRLTLYGDKIKLEKYLDKRSNRENSLDSEGRLNCYLPINLSEKFQVPMNAKLEDKLQWLAGYADTDGTISRNGQNDALQICSIHQNFLNQVKLMLQTLGCDAKVTPNKKSGVREMPDHKGGMKEYKYQATYRLLVNSNDLLHLVQLGFNPHRLVIRGNKPQRNSRQFIKITSTKHLKEKSDTYCFKESKRGMGLFNGIITGQCSEIVLYNDPSEETISVCNLAAIPLGSFVKTRSENNQSTPYFDFDDLGNSVRVAIQNLNRIIDVNFYPVQDCKNSNMKDRPVGLGVAGLYDVFIKMRMPFESDEAKQLNKDIFECMYYHACQTSMNLSKVEGPYDSFQGSPASMGKLQFDLWNEDRQRFNQSLTELNTKSYNWDQLKEDIKEHGLRNSTLMALMPTASTAQIVGQTESFECMTYNLYKRQVLSGDFKLINHYLQKDLIERNLWSEQLADKIIASRGSIQSFPDDEIPSDIKQLYKGAFEISQKKYLNQAIDRSAFLDQTQSLNIFVKDPSYTTLSTIQLYAWRNRLKTGQYYLRREAKAQTAQFTIRPQIKKGTRLAEKAKQKKDQQQPPDETDGPACSRDNPDCLACQV